MFKIGDKVKYIGTTYGVNNYVGAVVGYDGNVNIVHYPNVESIYLHNCGRFNKSEYLYIADCNLELVKENKGDDSMRKILVVGKTGNYITGANKGDILDVLCEGFGYVVTEKGDVKDIDYVEYKEGEMIAHINDLRDCFKAGLKFTDENNLVYPDGKIALKAENLQYLDRTFKLKRVNYNQIIIGNEKVELCFGKKEIGIIVEFRR